MTDNRAAERRNMVVSQLQSRGIQSPRVLAAMERIPRERFVPADFANAAYEDQALPIDCGQTISQPYIVALMTSALALSGTEHVLEIGTGSGYQTAILSELAGDVVTIERYKELSIAAQRVLTGLDYSNIRFVIGDGSVGFAEAAPFDRIIVTAAADRCPPGLLEQLSGNGILVGPFGSPDGQMLQAIHMTDGAARTSDLTLCRFVPLIADSPQGA